MHDTMTDTAKAVHRLREAERRFKVCPRCEGNFIPKRRDATYCYRAECRQTASPRVYEGLCTGVVGAISELEVSADLLKRGFEVFRAVSPACSCDLIAQKDGRSLRIEVRTGKKNANGKLCVPVDRFRADVLAVVVTGEGICYGKLNQKVFEPIHLD